MPDGGQGAGSSLVLVMLLLSRLTLRSLTKSGQRVGLPGSVVLLLSEVSTAMLHAGLQGTYIGLLLLASLLTMMTVHNLLKLLLRGVPPHGMGVTSACDESGEVSGVSELLKGVDVCWRGFKPVTD